MSRREELVVPPSPLRAVRSYRLLRSVTRKTRHRPFSCNRPPHYRELRAGGSMVLQLRDRGFHARAASRAAPLASERSTHAGSARTRTCGLGVGAELTKRPAVAGLNLMTGGY